MAPQGRDRRRKGVIACIRRALYGLMLWVCHMHAAQAIEGGRDADAIPPATAYNVTIRPLGNTNRWNASVERVRVLISREDSRLTPLFNRLSDLLRLRDHEFLEEMRKLEDGLGLDVTLPDAGNLHLLLHPREDELDAGKRWRLNPGAPGREEVQRKWSVGAIADLVETEIAGVPGSERRRRAVSPQVIMDADRMFGLGGNAVLTVQYAHWDGEHATDDDQMLQLRLKWRY